MLVEFSVTNFASFKNKVTINFEVMDLDPDHIFNPETRQKVNGLEINTINILYGKNASGKSNFLRAIQTFVDFINRPYLFRDKDNKDEVDRKIDFFDTNFPCCFDLKFRGQDAIEYDYHISISSDGCKIVKEKLESNAILIFERADENKINWYKGESEKYKALANDIDILNMLDYLYNEPIFYQRFKSLSEFQSNMETSTESFCFMGVKWRNRISKASSYNEDIIKNKDYIIETLQKADWDIIDLKYDENKEDIVFQHKSQKWLSYKKQSEGTKAFFKFIAHVFIKMNSGKHQIFVIDEIELSLHMKLVEHIVDLFRNPETNPNHCILLCSTHDVRLMHQSVTNADQIWLIDRDPDSQETSLRTIADYDGYDPIGLQHQYMNGDFGAVPNLGKEE
jgi:AAA15 family ATPase/GTPase